MKRAHFPLLFSRGSSAGQRHQDHLGLQLPRPPLCADGQAYPGRSVRTTATFSRGRDLMVLLWGERVVSRGAKRVDGCE